MKYYMVMVMNKLHNHNYIILYVNCFGRTVFYVCIEYRVKVNMYHVNAQGDDARIINVGYK